ncbi:E3 ubiquitin-protein ligase TRIM39-like [Podarcis raffonei]|uniref:E3 ubiquitin-protein ligase TRIM39-like n=1 Tax=Podarcis raffonei TaxID=65483 RepID=UPI00232961BC|nr:E3 ubiquitin-protein ligase TRIM39-like [Podarcis raffonei]
MASANPVQSLLHELTCSFCLKEFMDPVMLIGCGHNFCKACITKHWKGSLKNVCCPQCKRCFLKAELQQNGPLKKMVEASRQITWGSLKEPAVSESTCPSHKKPLTLFCQKDSILICAKCEDQHQDHTILPIQKAIDERKEQILSKLKQQQVSVERFKEALACGAKELLDQASLAHQALVTEVENFCQSLKDQAQFLVLYLEELKSTILKKKEEDDSKYTRDVTQLDVLTSAVETMCAQLGVELLKGPPQVDVLISEAEKIHRHRSDEFCKEYEMFTNWFGEEHYKENSSGDLENKCYEITELNKTLKKTFQKFKGQMATELWKARNKVLKKYEQESVYLDRDTAHTSLVLSEDQGSAWKSHESPEEMPYHPERFENRQCVLGLNGYTSGRVYWEVDVEKAKEWGAGVARKSVERKGPLDFNPDAGIWGVGLDRVGLNKGYWAFTLQGPIPLTVPKPLKKIQVYLDYNKGEVSFCNATDAETLIFTFPLAAFNGEQIYPWFWVGKGPIKICQLEPEDIEFKLVEAGLIKPWEYSGISGF